VEKKISLMLDDEVLKKVDEKAKESLRSRSKYVEYVLREKIKEDEKKEQ
jgi:metal-responsive CopG/Arc/MetJ family transcriptional regulator